jgi:tetratricopeptide (TPR) repeat protein
MDGPVRIAPSNTDATPPRWLLPAIVLGAFALRVVALVQLRGTPLWDSLGLDAAYYLETARRIVAGNWLGDEVFFMGPLYPYLLALVGGLSGFSLEAIRLVQVALGSIATLLLFEIGRRVADLRTATIAAVGLACYPMALYYDNHLLMTGLVLALLLVVLLDLLRLGESPRPRRLVRSGALLGIAALSRASLLLLLPGILLWLWLDGPGPAPRGAGHRPRDGRRGRRLLAYVAGVGLVLIVTLARNLVVGGDPVLVTSNGGLNLYIGNNPLGRGTYLPLAGVARAAGVPASVDISWMIEDPTGSAIAEAATGRRLRPSEVSRFYVDRTIDYVTAQPGRALAILGRKLLLFWNGTEIAQIEDPELYRELLPILRWPLPGFGIVAPLALAGMVIAWRRRRRLLLLYLTVLLYTLSIVLFFVTSRYRAPLVPVLLVFAAIAAGWLVDTARTAWSRRRAAAVRGPARRRLAVAAAGLLAAAVVVHLDLVHIDRAAAQISLGIAYIEDGRHAEAIAAFERAVEAEPGDVTARYNLAAAHLEAGDPAAAREAFLEALRLDPRSAVALGGLARAEAQLGHDAQAARALREATRLAPSRADLWLELGQLELGAGRRDSAIAALDHATRVDPGAFAAWSLLARLHAEDRDYARALQAARRAVAGQPADPQIHAQLGMLEAMHGEPERAARALRRALELAPRYLPARLALVRLLHEQGQPDAARAQLAIARRQAPGDPQVAAMARLIEGDPAAAAPER